MTRSLLLFLLVGCSAPVGQRAEPITNGTPTEGDPAVVFLEGAPLGCTGTLIAPDVVLTAAHCRAQDDPWSVRVGVGPTRESEATVGLLDAVAHPGFDDTADHDLALLLLADPLELAPVALDELGAVAAPPPVAVRLVGYGVTAAGAGDDGTKREGTSETAEVTDFFVQLAADPSLPCNGDSGGPVLVGERLGAVISRGDAECATQGKGTRVDVHLEDFIRPQLAAWDAGEIPAVFGEPCAANAECRSFECSASGLCSLRCVSGRGDCPEGFRCEFEGGTDFLCAPKPDSGRCSAGVGSPVGGLAVVVIALGWLRRRRAS